MSASKRPNVEPSARAEISKLAGNAFRCLVLSPSPLISVSRGLRRNNIRSSTGAAWPFALPMADEPVLGFADITCYD